MDNQKKSLNPYLLVILSFVIIIFIGAVLLMMPFATHKPGNFMDSLFLATSATCVTGLNSFKAGIGDTAAGLKFPGQLILMLLIQVGGLGFITLLTFIITLFYRKLQFKDRLLLSVMVNSEEAAEVVHFVRKIILISFSFEAFGFLLGLPVFLTSCKSIPEGIW